MTRLLSGVAMAASGFALVWFLPWMPLLGVTMALAALGFLEYARLARSIDADVPIAPTLVATLAACASMALPWVYLPSLLGVVLVGLAVSLMTSGRHGAPLFHGAAAAMMAPVYIGLPLGSLVAIHQLAGREGVVMLIATVVASDTFQYYSGRTFGNRPLAPTISPKKTIEGAIGGFVLAPITLVVFAHYWLPRLSPLGVWAAGLGIVTAGIAGDLFESSLKRAAGVKDSGTLIPGHGGVLDRFDALIFAAPLFLLLLKSA